MDANAIMGAMPWIQVYTHARVHPVVIAIYVIVLSTESSY